MALVLDGVNQYAKAPFSWSRTSDFSIAIKHKSAFYDASAGLVCAVNSAGPDDYFAGYFTAGSSQIAARERASDGFSSGVNYNALGADATDGGWNSLVVTYDSETDTLTLYQDNRSGITVVGSASSDGGDALLAGALIDDTASPFVFFEGKVAVMRGWTRRLSASEALDYNTAATLADVDAITGGTGPDLISDGTGATLFNSPTFDADSPFATTQTVRKSSTFDIETTLGTITTATLDGVNVFDDVTGQVGTTVSFAGAATDEITASGGYDLVLGDGATTETITLQVNVVGLPVYNLNKDGADLASLTDVEVIVMTGAAGSRAVSQNTASRATTAAGDTTAYEVTDLALTVDQNVFVVVSSAASGAGVAFTDTLELI